MAFPVAGLQLVWTSCYDICSECHIPVPGGPPSGPLATGSGISILAEMCRREGRLGMAEKKGKEFRGHFLPEKTFFPLRDGLLPVQGGREEAGNCH